MKWSEGQRYAPRPGTCAAGFLVALSLQREGTLLFPAPPASAWQLCLPVLYIILPAELAGQGPALKAISLSDPWAWRQAFCAHLGCVRPAALAVLWLSLVVELVGAALGPTLGAILGSLGGAHFIPSDFHPHPAHQSPLLAVMSSKCGPRFASAWCEGGLGLSGLPRWHLCLSPAIQTTL